MTRWLLHPARTWRRASGRARIYAFGLALFVAAEWGGMSGVLPLPVAWAVFIAGLAIAAIGIRPADRGSKP